jgi:hypothetical protein
VKKLGNMGYCRFTNTLEDLRDCYNHMSDDKEELGEEETEAREDLIQLCKSIAAEYAEAEDYT